MYIYISNVYEMEMQQLLATLILYIIRSSYNAAFV